MNFHGWIAIPLENKLRKIFGFDDRPIGTIFDADSIEGGSFYDVMCLILAKEKIEKWEDFANKYSQKDIEKMGIEDQYKVYQEFCNLIK